MNRILTVGLTCALVTGFIACGGGGSTPAPVTTGAAAVAPTITAQPANVTVPAGQMATFTIVAAGSSPLSYQWQKNGAAISGGTSASYTTPATASSDNGALFAVVVMNSAGSVTSNAATLSVAAPPVSTGSDVTTFKNDISRTGQNLTETTLTPANVTPATFGLVQKLMVDGKVDAQPLYLSQVLIGSAMHNVLLVATEHGSLYGFDADSFAKLWMVSLLQSGETPSDTHGCGQVVPEIGITSTPVVDRTAGSNGAVYVVAMSLDQSSNYHQRLHAVDVTTGSELFNGPVEISASYPNAGGTVTFVPGTYEERAALLLANGSIYTSWTSHCDQGSYQGWIMTFDRITLAHTGTLNVAPNAAGSGYASQGPAIWMSGDGPGADAAGNVYLLTGNGRFETTLTAGGFPNQGDYGNSFVRISGSGSTMSVSDYFTMRNEVAESSGDGDLGSGGEMLLPDMADSNRVIRHLVVGAGKDTTIYVVDRDNMGKFSATSNNIWQELDGQAGGAVFSSPAYFNNTVYYGGSGAPLRAFSITNAKLSASPTSQSSGAFGFPGTSPAVSANGTANAIVWAHENGSTAVLHAYDAANLAHELYNSNQASGSRDQFGSGNKFITPMISAGKVFVGTTNGVAVFGLLH